MQEPSPSTQDDEPEQSDGHRSRGSARRERTPMYCESCLKPFYGKTVEQHNDEVHKSSGVVCPACPGIFSQRKALVGHLERHRMLALKNSRTQNMNSTNSTNEAEAEGMRDDADTVGEDKVQEGGAADDSCALRPFSSICRKCYAPCHSTLSDGNENGQNSDHSCLDSAQTLLQANNGVIPEFAKPNWMEWTEVRASSSRDLSSWGNLLEESESHGGLTALVDTLSDVSRLEGTAERIAEYVQEICWHIHALRDCQIHIGGSYAAGMLTSTSDVDICVQIQPGDEPERLLKKLMQAVRNSGNGYRFEPRWRARVPVFRFHDQASRKEVDVGTGSADSLLKGLLFRHLCTWCPHLRPLCIALKQYASHHELNDAAVGTFSSYSLYWLAVVACQMNGFLPPLDFAQPLLERFTAFVQSHTSGGGGGGGDPRGSSTLPDGRNIWEAALACSAAELEAMHGPMLVQMARQRYEPNAVFHTVGPDASLELLMQWTVTFWAGNLLSVVALPAQGGVLRKWTLFAQPAANTNAPYSSSSLQQDYHYPPSFWAPYLTKHPVVIMDPCDDTYNTARVVHRKAALKLSSKLGAFPQFWRSYLQSTQA